MYNFVLTNGNYVRLIGNLAHYTSELGAHTLNISYDQSAKLS